MGEGEVFRRGFRCRSIAAARTTEAAGEGWLVETVLAVVMAQGRETAWRARFGVDVTPDYGKLGWLLLAHLQ